MPHLSQGSHQVSFQLTLLCSCTGSRLWVCVGPNSLGMWTVVVSVWSYGIPPQSEWLFTESGMQKNITRYREKTVQEKLNMRKINIKTIQKVTFKWSQSMLHCMYQFNRMLLKTTGGAFTDYFQFKQFLCNFPCFSGVFHFVFMPVCLNKSDLQLNIW